MARAWPLNLRCPPAPPEPAARVPGVPEVGNFYTMLKMCIKNRMWYYGRDNIGLQLLTLFITISGNHQIPLAILHHISGFQRKLDASRCSGSDVRCGGLGGKQLQEQIVGLLSI
jgi:hypothetical protein